MNAPIVSDIWQSIKPILDEYLHSNGDFPIGKLLYSQLKQDIPGLISDIESSADRIKRIVSVLKDYSAKNDSLVLAPLDINKAVDNATLLIGYKIKKHTSRFNIKLSDGLPPVTADQQKLEQVFVNLISNALEALPDKNKAVFVETLHDPKKRQVAVEIRDEGVGISPKNVARIMDPFFTTKRATGGTGLGLSIVQRIVNLHDGSIEIESQEGAGSTFRVVLPENRIMDKPKSLATDGDPNQGAI